MTTTDLDLAALWIPTTATVPQNLRVGSRYINMGNYYAPSFAYGEPATVVRPFTMGSRYLVAETHNGHRARVYLSGRFLTLAARYLSGRSTTAR
jgi:hypothetical protein